MQDYMQFVTKKKNDEKKHSKILVQFAKKKKKYADKHLFKHKCADKKICSVYLGYFFFLYF